MYITAKIKGPSKIYICVCVNNNYRRGHDLKRVDMEGVEVRGEEWGAEIT